MNNKTASSIDSEATYRAALSTVLTGMGPDDARSLRSYALRFLEHCLKEGIDPLLPGAKAFEQFSAEMSEGQRWRFAHAARRVLAEAGVRAVEHGLGLGDQSHLVRPAELWLELATVETGRGPLSPVEILADRELCDELLTELMR